MREYVLLPGQHLRTMRLGRPLLGTHRQGAGRSAVASVLARAHASAYDSMVSAIPEDSVQSLTALIGALSATFLVSCGGGGGPAPESPPPAAASIRFEVVYEPAAMPQDFTTPAGSLIVRALPGSTSLGTRAISSVELQLAQEAPRSLAAPSYVDAQGRPNYVFAVSADYPSTFQFRSCTSFIPFELTVTDEAGLVFTKYGQLCPGQAQSVGAFSD